MLVQLKQNSPERLSLLAVVAGAANLSEGRVDGSLCFAFLPFVVPYGQCYMLFIHCCLCHEHQLLSAKCGE